MILVKLGRADSECSTGELLHTNFKADGFNVTLEEKRVKLAIGQESHASACDIELNNDVSQQKKGRCVRKDFDTVKMLPWRLMQSRM
jgi:hypothetical protein